MCLHQRPRIAGIGLEVQHTIRMCIQDGIVAHFFERRQADDSAAAIAACIGYESQHLVVALRAFFLLRRTGLAFLGIHVGADNLVDAAGSVDACRVDFPPALRLVLTDECRAAHIGDVGKRFAACDAMR